MHRRPVPHHPISEANGKLRREGAQPGVREINRSFHCGDSNDRSPSLFAVAAARRCREFKEVKRHERSSDSNATDDR